jgi:integrase/recombinase XerD
VPIEHTPPSEIAIPASKPGSPAARAVAAYLARLAPNSHRAVLGRLRAVASVLAGPNGTVAWHTFDYPRLIQLRDDLQSHGVTPPMINLTLVVLRGITAAAADIGLVSQGVAGELKLVRGVSVPYDRPAPGRVVKPSDVAALFSICWQDRSIAGARDLAIIHGIYWAGLSNAELAGIQVENFTSAPAELWIEPARSARRRRVGLTGETAAVFERWRATRGPHPGGLFLRLGRTRSIANRHTTPSAIANVVRKRAKQAGLTPVGAQDLRRTAIYNLIEAGVSLAEVHRQVGFVSHLTLAAHYDHRDLTDQRRFVWLTTDLPGLSLGAASSSECDK